MTESHSTGYTSGAPRTDGRDRFFGWLRTLDIRRSGGWAGGVCSGIARRIGIDPLIVRGIAVVAALLGAPALLLYAVAWALLPDEGGHIHFEDVLHGQFTPPAIGIGLIVLFSFLPFGRGIWWLGAPFGGSGFWPVSVVGTIWTLLVVAGIVVLIVWLVRSAKAYRDAGAPAQPWMRGSATASAGSQTTTAAAPAPGAPESTAQFQADGSGTASPADPGATAPAGDEAWRAVQDEWRARQAAWAARQAESRAARQQRSESVRAQSAAMSAQYQAAARVRRAANPRTSGAFIGITLGVALLAGGVGGAMALAGAAPAYAGTIGLAAAGGAVGLGMVVAGLMRRRSGFLTFVALVLVGCAVLTAVASRGDVHDGPFLVFQFGASAAALPSAESVA